MCGMESEFDTRITRDQTTGFDHVEHHQCPDLLFHNHAGLEVNFQRYREYPGCEASYAANIQPTRPLKSHPNDSPVQATPLAGPRFTSAFHRITDSSRTTAINDRDRMAARLKPRARGCLFTRGGHDWPIASPTIRRSRQH